MVSFCLPKGRQNTYNPRSICAINEPFLMIKQRFSPLTLGMLIFKCYMLTDPTAGWPLQVRTCLVTYSKHDHNPRNRQPIRPWWRFCCDSILSTLENKREQSGSFTRVEQFRKSNDFESKKLQEAAEETNINSLFEGWERENISIWRVMVWIRN